MVNFYAMVNVAVCPIVEDLALKLIFANALLNPLFHGLCRAKYRKGYVYMSHSLLHCICFPCVDKPGGMNSYYIPSNRKHHISTFSCTLLFGHSCTIVWGSYDCVLLLLYFFVVYLLIVCVFIFAMYFLFR